MRILVIGKNGQVGRELSRLFSLNAAAVFVGRAECDLSNHQSVREVVRRVKPEVILNAAAYTAVDQAESDRELCFAINATGPGVLAQEAERMGSLLVHYSSDYVFDGEKPTPYVETDPISPVSAYGASKAAGEAAIAQAGGHSLILRTSWVYDAQGRNFLRTMLRLGEERRELRVVDDQVGAPTSAAAIGSATKRLVEQFATTGLERVSGIYHMTAGGSASWCGFARAIFDTGVLSTPPRVQAIASSEYPTPARRPANSLLSNEAFALTFGFRMAPWQEQLHEVIAEMQPAR